MDRKTFGQSAETFARHFLENKGYHFLSSNYHCPFGEIDLIFEDNSMVVFVEVKARMNNSFGSPAEAVTKSKLEKIRKTVAYYFETHPNSQITGRIDVVEVTVSNGEMRANHLENVFFES